MIGTIRDIAAASALVVFAIGVNGMAGLLQALN